MMLSCRVPTARPFTATRPGLRTVPVAVRTQQGVAAPRPEVLLRVAEGTELAPGEIVAADDGEFDAVDDFGEDDFRGRAKDNKPNFKHFLPLPKPAHLVYIKPTVAVVAGKANRNSVGLRMTAQGSNLERYVIEYYARSVK